MFVLDELVFVDLEDGLNQGNSLICVICDKEVKQCCFLAAEIGKIYMFYGGAYNCSPQQIGCAVSSDGRVFDKLFIDEPFIPCGKPGSWNSDESGHPYIFRDDDERYWLFYQGSNDDGEKWRITRTEIGFDDDGIPYKIGCPTEGIK